MRSIFFLVFFSFFAFVGNAQQSEVRIKRETIGSSGLSSVTTDFKIQATIGQSSLVSNETENNYLHISQGFQKAASGRQKFQDWSIDVYPNPNNGSFNFSTTLPESESFDFEILDARGRLIYENSGFGGTMISVNLNGVFDGYYFLKVQTKYSLNTFKLALFQ